MNPPTACPWRAYLSPARFALVERSFTFRLTLTT
jgi:hypothetical protein